MSQNNNNGVLLKIRKSRTFKGLAVCLALNLFFEMVHPTISLALTEGPSQPEVQSFEPIGTTQMVDLFSGDFNYNIPLFNLPGPNGGYPVNLSYHAGVTMDDEASWVGLGWNINAGALVRNKRGLPDEFLSQEKSSKIADDTYDHIQVKSDQKQSWTLGLSGSISEEVLGASILPDAGLSTSVYFNNYRGAGVSLEPSWAIGKSDVFSLGLSLDSESGLGLNASFKHDALRGIGENKHSLGVNFGGDLTLSYSLESEKRVYSRKSGIDNIAFKAGSSFSYATANFIPSVGRELTNFSISASVGFGLGGPPLFKAITGLGANFQTQDYKSRDKNGRNILVAGYSNLGDNDITKHFTNDFMRHNDGPLHRGSVMLASPVYTHDTYTSSGQGLAGHFRSKRNDIGRATDVYVRNEVFGFSLGATIGLPTTPGGTWQFEVSDIGGTFGWDVQKAWDNKNAYNDDFQNPNVGDGIKETTYYKVHGEPTIHLDSDLTYMNGLSLSNPRLMSNGAGKYEVSNVSFNSDGHDEDHRFVRNTLVHSLDNKEVRSLGEYDIDYYTAGTSVYDTPNETLKRDKRYDRDGDGVADVNINNHDAGFKVLNEQGSYYVYALPAYNNYEVENLFSVREHDDTDLVDVNLEGDEIDYKLKQENLDIRNKSHKFIDKKTTSPYAHAFMLTSIQGADYVDVTNNGPSEDDLGYWVKFSYKKATDKYQWRAPYDSEKAQYHPGAAYHSDDDKASYQYGEKELWYMSRMETKSHVAIFVLEGRNDNKEAKGEYPGSTMSPIDSDHGLRIEKIEVYDKESFNASADPKNDPDLKPLQTVHFDYSYELCEEIQNFQAGNDPYYSSSKNGKLTLKRVWFTSLGSTRGEDSAYEFDYSTVNPDYTPNGFDGWGVYKPKHDNPQSPGTLDNDFISRFPYTTQFDQDWNPAYQTEYLNGETAKEIQDANASAWNLTQIKLPSGGIINVEYESDDYSHVQHKVANQMFKITKLGDFTDPDELYKGTSENNLYADVSSGDDEARRRIYFKLEEPLVTSSASDQAQEVFSKYVEPIIEYNDLGERSIYFKSRIRLLKGGDVWDYVSGYLPVESELTNPDGFNYGAVGNQGFITVQPAQKRNGDFYDQYHPISVAAWNFMQSSSPEIINNPNSFNGDNTNQDNFLGKVVDALNVVPQLLTTFGALKKYCKSKDMARYIDLSKSCIRLASPDKRKLGGGHRVKQISMSDEWSPNSGQAADEYGQVFDYNILENDQVISSGVAQYEPQAIGDENALKHPVYSYNKVNLFTQNNLFAEMPVNEALYPGAAVGYRKVTVRSLNTSEAQRNFETDETLDYGRTGGVTVHEFYTAKEFPTTESRSQLSKVNSTKHIFNVPIPIPFVGSINRKYFHGTQSFMVETNDMHGKPKSVRTFEVNNYVLNANPITETVQEYQCKSKVYQGENIYVLDNMIDVIESDNPTLNVTEDYGRMGVEVDMFTDQREIKNFSQQAGVDVGVDLPNFFPTPFPEIWPTFNNSKSLFRTFVTNKVVHRSGILKRTKTKDLQTVNESEILAYDEKAGIPLLTRVTNEFGDNFYNYNVPAYYHYENMGHAYQNIGFKFSKFIQFDITDGFGNPISQGDVCIDVPTDADMMDHLIRGDELLVTESSPIGALNMYRKAYFLGWIYNGANKTHARIQILNAKPQTTTKWYKFKVIRSGRRNHYGAMGANYSTKGELAIGTTNTPVATVDGAYAGMNTITTNDISENTVLAASASLYKDTWNGTNDLRQGPEKVFVQDPEVENPYLTGNAGIWRPYKSYSYVGSRRSTASLNNNLDIDPDLRNDGVFEDEVPMFTWEIGNLEEHLPKWEWVNEVTRFSSDSYETENMNRLGIKSSALYGYDNSLTIAVGGNAGYYELGAVDFETSEPSWSHGKSMVQTNMNFNNTSLFVNEVYTTDVLPIQLAEFNGTNLEVTTNIPFADFNSADYMSNVRLTLNSIGVNNYEGNESYYLNGEVDFSTVSNVGGFAKFIVNTFYCDPLETVLPLASFYTGKVRVLVSRDVSSSQGVGTVQFTDDKAHTGKKSMKLTGTTTFDQPMLKPIKDKPYVVSLWISRDEKARTYKAPFLQGAPVVMGTFVSGTFGNSNIVIENPTYSKVIEGWQKVDFEFYVTSHNAILGFKFKPGTSDLYVDDIRFSPKTGGITTHVYDPNRMWLRASLNVDNYATLFYYDEQGNLTMKKQETEEGIFTITESRGHVQKD